MKRTMHYAPWIVCEDYDYELNCYFNGERNVQMIADGLLDELEKDSTRTVLNLDLEDVIVTASVATFHEYTDGITAKFLITVNSKKSNAYGIMDMMVTRKDG